MRELYLKLWWKFVSLDIVVILRVYSWCAFVATHVENWHVILLSKKPRPQIPKVHPLAYPNSLSKSTSARGIWLFSSHVSLEWQMAFCFGAYLHITLFLPLCTPSWHVHFIALLERVIYCWLWLQNHHNFWTSAKSIASPWLNC